MKLIIGCGYLGLRAAQRWLAAGEQVAALTRSTGRAAELKQLGIQPLIGDVTKPAELEQLQQLPAISTVLYAVGFDRNAGQAMSTVYIDGLCNVLDHLPKTCRRLIYISSTGVYGQTQGEIVNEDSPTEPTREGGRVCLAAEHSLQQHPLGQRAIILRLAGIYGPDRVPNRRDLLQQVPLQVDPQSYLNLIHVEDAVSTIIAAEATVEAPRLYLVADGNPVRRADYYSEAARLWHTPPPIFAGQDQHQPRRSNGDKLIDVARLRNELKIPWRYIDYRAGLADIAAAEQTADSDQASI